MAARLGEASGMFSKEEEEKAKAILSLLPKPEAQP